MTPTIHVRAKVSRLNMFGVRSAAKAELVAIAEETRADYVAQITQNPRRGKTVKRYGPGKGKKRVVTISAPGDAPAGDLGQLANSAFVDDSVGPLEVGVGVAAQYAAALEFDAPTPEDSDPENINLGQHARPAFVPAVKRARRDFDDRMARAAERELEKLAVFAEFDLRGT